jgi:hypothetical protein
MDIIVISLIVIAAILVIVGVALAIVVAKRRREGKVQEVNYRAFYITGIIMLPLGLVWIAISIATDLSFVTGIPLLGIGVVYIAIGLANRDKWIRNK